LKLTSFCCSGPATGTKRLVITWQDAGNGLGKFSEGIADTKCVELLRQSMGMNCDPAF